MRLAIALNIALLHTIIVQKEIGNEMKQRATLKHIILQPQIHTERTDTHSSQRNQLQGGHIIEVEQT